jgi:anti-anti-sigma regulatory factor
MPVTAAYIEEEERLDLVFAGNLDVTLCRDVCQVCDRITPGLRTCILDLTAVGCVFDFGAALLGMLYQRLAKVGATLVLLGVRPDVKAALPFPTGDRALVYGA